MADGTSSGSSVDGHFIVERVKRTRKTGSRSKTGCITCRLRRVKCDELKPACLRCTNARRKCEGYPSIFAITKPWEVIMDPTLGSIIKPSSNPRVASNDHAIQSFQFFKEFSIGKLAEVFGKELWTEAVPRAALHCPAIWYATIALGSAHEAHWLKNIGPGLHESKTDWTLEQYNRAIRALTQPDRNGVRPPPEVMITASILFMTFEASVIMGTVMLRGEQGKAIAHAKSGMSMYREYRRGLSPDDRNDAKHTVIPLRHLERSLRQVEIQLCELTLERYPTYPLPTVSFFDRQSMPYESLPDPVVCTNFRDLDHARVELGWHWHTLMDKLHFNFKPEAYGPLPYSEGFDGQREMYYHALVSWCNKFQALVLGMKLRSLPLTSLERGSIARLQTYEILLLQLLETYKNRGEMLWDQHTDRFERILDLCKITASNDEFGDPACDMIKADAYCGFQLGNGIIAACFHVIWKCRAARVRLKAIKLLQTYPRREALWDARMVVHVGKYLDELERGSGCLHEAALRNADPEEIPSWARVRCIGVQFGATNRSAELTFIQPTSQLDEILVKIRRNISW